MRQFIDRLNFNILILRTGRFGAPAAAPPFFRIVKINRSAAGLLGYSQQALEDQPFERLFASSDTLISVTRVITGVIDNPADNCFETTLITHDRRNIPVLLTVSPIAKQHSNDLEVVLLIQTIKPDDERVMMQRVVEQSASAVMITDHAGRIDYINPKFIEMTGYNAEELIGENPKLLQSGNMSPEHYQRMWESLQTTGEWRGEIQNRKKNGDIYWAFESVSAVKNSAGKITHFLAVEEDITRRKQAEFALTESEERFRQMAEMTCEWLWEQDPEGYYLYSSNAVQHILGFSPADIIGKHYTEFLTLQDKQTQQTFTKSRQPFYALTNHYQHKNGQQIITESTGLPILDIRGKLIKWRGVDRDVTARMHFQNALIDSEKRTRLVIDSSINAIVIMDSYGIITDWNYRAEKMFGWSRDEALTRRLDELIIPVRFRRPHREGLQKFLKTGIGPFLNQQLEHVALRRDGTEFPIELSVSPLKIGNAFIFSGFIHDISGRKAAEREIRQAQVNLAIAKNEIHIAQQIQASLSPEQPIKTNNFEVVGTCLPANQVSGDYFDYFFRNQSQLDIVIADVSGHAIGPALFMVETRSAIRAQTNLSATPSETLGTLNSFLFNDLNNSDYFISLFYLQVDIDRLQLRFANAGHPPPLLINCVQPVIRELDADGLILGVKTQVTFEEKSLNLTAGDLILFYTDGLTEAENPHNEFFGLERVKTILRQNAQETPQIIIESLFAALQQFCQRSVFNDDITLMIFKYK